MQAGKSSALDVEFFAFIDNDPTFEPSTYNMDLSHYKKNVNIELDRFQLPSSLTRLRTKIDDFGRFRQKPFIKPDYRYLFVCINAIPMFENEQTARKLGNRTKTNQFRIDTDKRKL